VRPPSRSTNDLARARYFFWRVPLSVRPRVATPSSASIGGWRLSTRNAQTLIEGIETRVSELAPLEELRALLSSYRTYVTSELPDFIGGAVGL